MKFGISTYFIVNKHILDVIDELISSGVRTIEISHEIPHSLNMDGNFLRKMQSFK